MSDHERQFPVPRVNRIQAVLLASVVAACCHTGLRGDRPTAGPSAAPGSAPAPAAAPAVEPTALTAAQIERDQALEPEAAAVIDTFASFNARVSPDGRHALFLSDRDGTAQAYLGGIDQPGDPPIQLTRGPDGVHWASFTRDGRHVVFTRDIGHDENFRIFRVSLDGKDEENLTPGESLHRDNPLLPLARPGTMVFSARHTSRPGTRLHVQPLDGRDGKLVYTHPVPAYATDAAPDASRVLLIQPNSRSDRVLFEVDVARGTARRLFPAAGAQAAVGDARYGADGRRVYLTTDEGGEDSVVLALNAATGAVEARHLVDQPRAALALSLETAPSGDRIAVLVMAGNHSVVRILDARTLAPRVEVQHGLGLVELGTFTGDGNGLAFVLATPEQPWDVHLADTHSGRARPLRRDARPGMERLGHMAVTIEEVTAFDGLTIPVNVYRAAPGPPARAGAAPARRPTIVFFHGGPAWSSQVTWNPLARFLVGRGFAFVEPNVRGSTGFGRAYEQADDRDRRGDVMKDLKSVNRWVKAQPWCDPDRVVVMGLSYGGYLTLMALTRQPGLWRAGVDLFGVADLRTLLASTDQTVRFALVNEFGDPERDAALLAEYSPLRDVDRIVAPLFVYAGANDPRVPRSESDLIVGALRRRGVPVEYMVAANEGHSFDHRETRVELYARVARFLDEAMR
jgi:dipeptidyl aminopeptidase/acylaminoacyl peptidase